jgi:hypothetical protein
MRGATRSSLFTLLGIAGEDDLDAPDLVTPTAQTSRPEKPKGQGNSRLNGQRPHPAKPGALNAARLRAHMPKAFPAHELLCQPFKRQRSPLKVCSERSQEARASDSGIYLCS